MIVRGHSGPSDYEVNMNQINKEIFNDKVNIVCLFADKDCRFVSSSMVKGVFNLGKDVTRYGDPIVYEKMLIKRR